MTLTTTSNVQIYMDDLGRPCVGQRGLGRHEEGGYREGVYHTTGRILRPAHPAEMAQLRRDAKKNGYPTVAASVAAQA
jgi:hypothetical protein